MDERIYKRHMRFWRFLHRFARPFIERKYRFSAEEIPLEGAFLLIPNHVTSMDPLFIWIARGRKEPIYLVASEHLYRLGFVSKIIQRYLPPIAKSKGNTGVDTAQQILKTLKDGRSVALFAEGEQSWMGRNIPIVPGTEKIVKLARVPLVTYRLEGGYPALPRWSSKRRRGRITGHVVGIYPPEELRKLSREEIAGIINRDIREDAWERQRQEPVPYKGRRLAEGLERALYLCPECRRIGTLTTKKDQILCRCGLKIIYTETGFLKPEKPFENIADWDDWQRSSLRLLDFVHQEQEPYFSDEEVSLTRIEDDHREVKLGKGRIVQYEDRLECVGNTFSLDDIKGMAMVQADRLLISTAEEYYEVRAKGRTNLRKYLEYREGRI